MPKNHERLRHIIASKGKDGTGAEVITYKYVYNKQIILKEIYLDEDEDFFINYKIDEQTFKKDITQLNLLLSQLEQIFHYIEPVISNEQTYGIFLRDLIIKSSTEVETHWKELMILNGYKKEGLTTKDYCKLMEFINFNFELKLVNYPNYREIIPFLNWSSESPTKSLNWYNVYNILKHDRTNSLDNATLINAINSVAAVYTLFSVRYSSLSEIQPLFRISKSVKTSKWKLYSIYKTFTRTKYLKYFDEQRLI